MAIPKDERDRMREMLKWPEGATAHLWPQNVRALLDDLDALEASTAAVWLVFVPTPGSEGLHDEKDVLGVFATEQLAQNWVSSQPIHDEYTVERWDVARGEEGQ